jgi:cobalt/nickel transport system permease protein
MMEMPDDTVTPGWLRSASSGDSRGWSSGTARRESAIAKTTLGLSRLVRGSVYSEKIAARPGLLQGLDPRVKVVGIICLLLTASLLRNWYMLLLLYGVAVFLAAASNISLKFFVRRVWLFIPIFAAIIVLPSIFNIVRPGDPLWIIWDFGHEVTLGPWSLGSYLAITYQGVKGAVVLILRVVASVSFGVLLALTTRWSDLLKALRVFFVPRIFILVLSMTYRYIFLLLGMAEDMFAARTSRMVGPSSQREDRRFMASSMGTMLGKSHSLSDEVYSAMLSRGFNGEPMTTHAFHARGSDWLWLGIVALFTVAALGGDRLVG